MSVPYFICGVARVAVPAAFTTVVFVDSAAGLVLAIPFGLLVLGVALYDACARRWRKR